LEYNKKYHITPQTIKKAILDGIEKEEQSEEIAASALSFNVSDYEGVELIKKLEEEMLEAAQKLEFEKAAEVRDLINEIKTKQSFPKKLIKRL
jgi:excinuclease ABC subunit B